jgi:hypothetical protein
VCGYSLARDMVHVRNFAHLDTCDYWNSFTGVHFPAGAPADVPSIDALIVADGEELFRDHTLRNSCWV